MNLETKYNIQALDLLIKMYTLSFVGRLIQRNLGIRITNPRCSCLNVWLQTIFTLCRCTLVLYALYSVPQDIWSFIYQSFADVYSSFILKITDVDGVFDWFNYLLSWVIWIVFYVILLISLMILVMFLLHNLDEGTLHD